MMVRVGVGVGGCDAAVANVEGAPVDFEAGRLEDGLHGGAFVRAGGEFVEGADFLLEFEQAYRQRCGAGQVDDDAVCAVLRDEEKDGWIEKGK